MGEHKQLKDKLDKTYHYWNKRENSYWEWNTLEEAIDNRNIIRDLPFTMRPKKIFNNSSNETN